MTSLMVETLWLAITQIEAQEILSKLSVADWPNMKKEARAKRHRDLFKMAYPEKNSKKAITPNDLARILGGKNG